MSEYDFEAWRRHMNEVADECVALLERKQRDYGPKNIAAAPGGPIQGLMVRMYDKIARIENLNRSFADPQNESLVDSFMDLANYGIIGVMVLKGYWPGATPPSVSVDESITATRIARERRARMDPGTVYTTNDPSSVIREHLLGPESSFWE